MRKRWSIFGDQPNPIQPNWLEKIKNPNSKLTQKSIKDYSNSRKLSNCYKIVSNRLKWKRKLQKYEQMKEDKIHLIVPKKVVPEESMT